MGKGTHATLRGSLFVGRALALGSLTSACLMSACSAGSGDDPSTLGRAETGLGLLPPQPLPPIPSTGMATPAFAPLDAAMRRFMSERCVGGAVVGVAYHGTILHNRGFGYKDGPPSAACSTAKDPFVGGEQIQPDAPFRIGSNGKAVLAAVVRLELKKALAAVRGAPVTDEDILTLKLIDNGELELVSPAVRAAMLAGGDLSGFSGQPCAVVNPWPKVLVGHLLSHRSGLPRGNADPYAQLSRIRGLDTTPEASAQETASGAPDAARAALKEDRGNRAYFVPPHDIEEYAIAQGSRCFDNEPGAASQYSNAGFGMLGYVLEHVTGKSFNAKNGYPFTHGWSLLSDFTEAELGFSTGIELSHSALGKRDPAEPRYREWRGATYYPEESDDKRPWCVLSGGRCDFALWSSGQSRFDWEWNEATVPFTYGAHSVTGGPGRLAAEAPRFLAFMNRYAVSLPYGRDRASFVPTSNIEHRGALPGSVSWVAQLVEGTLEYRAFAERPDGTTSYDYGSSRVASCSVPAGIDVFVAMNQTMDAKCTAESACIVCTDATCKKKESAYTLYPQLLKRALCDVDWRSVDLGSRGLASLTK